MQDSEVILSRSRTQNYTIQLTTCFTLLELAVMYRADELFQRSVAAHQLASTGRALTDLWPGRDRSSSNNPHDSDSQYLQVSQTGCPAAHWKILVGGTISSMQAGHSGTFGTSWGASPLIITSSLALRVFILSRIAASSEDNSVNWFSSCIFQSNCFPASCSSFDMSSASFVSR